MTFQFERCFLLAQDRMWNEQSCVLFDYGALNGFMGVVNRIIEYSHNTGVVLFPLYYNGM